MTCQRRATSVTTAPGSVVSAMIPVALITGLLFQLTVIIWGAAILFNKVDDHARRIAKFEATDDDVRRDASRIS
jgi:hypothetical protein